MFERNAYYYWVQLLPEYAMLNMLRRVFSFFFACCQVLGFFFCLFWQILFRSLWCPCHSFAIFERVGVQRCALYNAHKLMCLSAGLWLIDSLKVLEVLRLSALKCLLNVTCQKQNWWSDNKSIILNFYALIEPIARFFTISNQTLTYIYDRLLRIWVFSFLINSSEAQNASSPLALASNMGARWC